MSKLIITADDYGLRPAYDAGILEAARAGALDAVSSFVLGPDLDPEPLLETGVEIGLHLDLGAPADSPRAGAAEREQAGIDIWMQIERFLKHYDTRPAYLDGHHHSHARPGLGIVVCDIASSLGIPVRSIHARHRSLLRCRGVATPDLLIGRLDESEPALPPELAGDGLSGKEVVEWMVHPGHPDPASDSGYNAGREQDLNLILNFTPGEGVERTTHRRALDPALAAASPVPGADACVADD